MVETFYVHTAAAAADPCRSFGKAGSALLGWWEGRHFAKTQAYALELGSTGAKIVAEDAPPAASTVWLKLQSPEGGAWIEGDVFCVQGSNDGFAEILMTFRDDGSSVFYRWLGRPAVAASSGR